MIEYHESSPPFRKGGFFQRGKIATSLFALTLLFSGISGPPALAQPLEEYFRCDVGLVGAPVAIDTGQFDTDGSADIAVVDEAGDRVLILLTDAEAFAAGVCNQLIKSASQVGVDDGPVALGVGNLEQDGDLDIAVAEDRGAVVLAGDGQGNFTARAPIPAGLEPRSIVIADFDRDGFQGPRRRYGRRTESRAPVWTRGWWLSGTGGAISNGPIGGCLRHGRLKS